MSGSRDSITLYTIHPFIIKTVNHSLPGFQEWLEHYHMRSISETVNSMVKCRFGAPLRKRLDARKATETQLKNVAHNVRRIGYLEIMDGIIPHWSPKGG